MSIPAISKPFHMHGKIPEIAEKFGIWEKMSQNTENFHSVIDVLEIANEHSFDCFVEICKQYGCDPYEIHAFYSHIFVKEQITEEEYDDMRIQEEVINHYMRQLIDPDSDEDEMFWDRMKEKYSEEKIAMIRK